MVWFPRRPDLLLAQQVATCILKQQSASRSRPFTCVCLLQEDALRPLVAVLKHSDSGNVREQVVALIAHSITAHPRGLGSGDQIPWAS